MRSPDDSIACSSSTARASRATRSAATQLLHLVFERAWLDDDDFVAVTSSKRNRRKAVDALTQELYDQPELACSSHRLDHAHDPVHSADHNPLAHVKRLRAGDATGANQFVATTQLVPIADRGHDRRATGRVPTTLDV